ncbi:MAG: FadR/GntR family transcriptional regulator [Candidatus Limnocylindrales bacterium]
MHRDLVDTLGRRVVKGGVVPGETFPNEADLSAELDVSRTVIREAVKVLASKGLVDTRPKTGTRVMPRDRWNLIDPDVLHWLFEDGGDEGLLSQLSEVRMIVEPAAAALAARRRTEVELLGLVGLLEDMVRLTDDADAYIGADLAFHSAILSAAHNELLARMAATIHEALIASRRVTVRIPGGPSKATPHHALVVAAIRTRNGRAASRAMERLVQATWHDVETILHHDGGPIDR